MDYPSDFEPVSRATIWQIAWQVRDGEADVGDVKRLLMTVCYHFKRQEKLPKELHMFLADAFSRYLSGQATIEAALGLKKCKSGRRKIDADISTQIAAEFLRHRLEGLSWDDAIESTRKVVCKSKTVIEEAWAHHRHDARVVLRIERVLDKKPFSEEEVVVLEKIFKKEASLISPDNSNKKAG